MDARNNDFDFDFTSLLKLGISGSPRSDLRDMLCLLSSGYENLACDER